MTAKYLIIAANYGILYSHDSDVWSCTWDLDDPTYFYAGLKSGDVYLYDIRVTNRYVHELPRFGCKTPVVALQYLKKTSCSSYSKCGPVVGKLSNCAFYQKHRQQDGDYKIVPLPTIGPYTSLCSEPVSGHFLVSSRPSPKQPFVTHTVCELVSDQIEEDLICNPIQTLQGGRTQLQLARSKLFPHPEDASSLLICAGDEDAQGALVWDGSSGKIIDTLRAESLVLDLAELKINHKTFLLALTDKTLRLFGWENQ
ncbi:e3 ubiquitin-protein ligase RFWD3 [Trichonephila clavipes]|nr:e3 ubiquitin-protein ligase RFWD3 [Trichonephila clavipes]